MKITDTLISCIVGIAFLVILVTGVDLDNSRVGFGMVLLGVGGAILGVRCIFGGLSQGRPSMILISILGSGYFIWRAVAGGPLSLAVADMALILIAICSYLIGATGSDKVIRLIFYGWIIACLANVCVAMAQLSSDSFFYIWRDIAGGESKPTGLFGHYNPFASFLNISAFVMLSFASRAGQMKWRISAGLLFVILIGAMIASGSRGGGLSFMVGFLVWVLVILVDLKVRRSKRFGVALLGVSVAGVLVLLAGSLLVNNINVRRSAEATERHGTKIESEMDDGGRLVFQQMAFDIFQESPLIGSGPRAFSYKAYDHWEFDEHEAWNHDPEFAHNEFLQTLSDYGLIGFLVLLVVFFTHGVVGLLGVVTTGGKRDGFITTLQIGAFGGLAALLMQSYFSFLIHFPTLVVLMAFLVSLLIRGRTGKPEAGLRICSKLIGGALVIASVSVAVIGLSFGQSYLLKSQSRTALGSNLTPGRSFEVLNSFADAAEKGFESSILEGSGRVAMSYASEAERSRNPELARKYRLVALAHFQRALELNPHASIAISGLPQVYDALGEFDLAEDGHRVAIEKIWIRENFLRPYFHAARSSFIRGVYACEEEEFSEGYRFLKASLDRLQKREELLERFRESLEEKSMRLEAKAWMAFIEGQRLYREGDRVWKEARPRNPELACALMIAASEKYQESKEFLEPVNSLWRAQSAQLQENLKLFEIVKTKPALLTEKQISDITNPEAGLDPKPATR